MAIAHIQNGEPKASYREKLKAVIDFGLGPGHSDNLETLGHARLPMNEIARQLGLEGWAEQEYGAIARERINAIIDALDIPIPDAVLYLDFLTGRYFGAAPTVTRATGGSYFDKDRILRMAGPNEPRFDHDPVTGAPRGWLFEEGGVNFALYSEGGGGWYAEGSTPPTLSAAAEHYGVACASITFEASSDPGYGGSRAARTDSAASVLADIAYIHSTFVSLSRPLEGDEALYFYLTGSGVSPGFSFTAANSGEFVGHWGRVVLAPHTLPEPGVMWPVVYLGAELQSDLTVYVTRSQSEYSSAATSYIPTAGAAVVRAADHAYVDLTSLPINLSEPFSLLIDAEYSPPGANSFGPGVDSGSWTNSIGMYANNSHPYVGQLISETGGVHAQQFATGLSPIARRVRAAFRIENGDNGLSANGASAVTSAGVQPEGLTILRLGTVVEAGRFPYHHVRQAALIPRGLSNAELEEMSAL